MSKIKQRPAASACLLRQQPVGLDPAGDDQRLDQLEVVFMVLGARAKIRGKASVDLPAPVFIMDVPFAMAIQALTRAAQPVNRELSNPFLAFVLMGLSWALPGERPVGAPERVKLFFVAHEIVNSPLPLSKMQLPLNDVWCAQRRKS